MSNQTKPCVFCEIVAGRAESSNLYEDEKIVAFMNIHPVHPGEFMVIPKEHIDHFIDIPDDVAAHILTHAQRLARKAQTVLKPKRMGYVVHGFGVPHAHLNVIPMHHSDDIASGALARIENGTIVFSEKHLPIVPRAELERMAQDIKGS